MNILLIILLHFCLSMILNYFKEVCSVVVLLLLLFKSLWIYALIHVEFKVEFLVENFNGNKVKLCERNGHLQSVISCKHSYVPSASAMNMHAAADNKYSPVQSSPLTSFVAADFTRLVKIKEWVDSHDPGASVIPFSGGLESQLQDKSEEEMQKYCTDCKTQRLISIQSPHTLLSAVSSMHSFNCMCW